MSRFSVFIFFSMLSSWAIANPHIEKANNDLERKNLIGIWHCQGSTPTLRYNHFTTYQSNQNYTESGSASIYRDGKWIPMHYEGRGQWTLKSNEYLNISQYSVTLLEEYILEDQQKQHINTYFAQVPFHRAIVQRSNGKMLVLEYKDIYNQTATLRCNKKRA